VAELGFPVSPVLPMPLHQLSGVGARATIQYLRLREGMGRMRAQLRLRAPFKA